MCVSDVAFAYATVHAARRNKLWIEQPLGHGEIVCFISNLTVLQECLLQNGSQVDKDCLKGRFLIRIQNF